MSDFTVTKRDVVFKRSEVGAELTALNRALETVVTQLSKNRSYFRLEATQVSRMPHIYFGVTHDTIRFYVSYFPRVFTTLEKAGYKVTILSPVEESYKRIAAVVSL